MHIHTSTYHMHICTCNMHRCISAMHRVLNYFVRWNAPICVQIFCTSMRAMSSNALSQPPQPDADLVVLDQTSKVDDLAVALSSWDFPPDAYPNGWFFDGQGKLKFNYTLKPPCGLGPVWARCIEVLLLRNASMAWMHVKKKPRHIKTIGCCGTPERRLETGGREG